MSTAIPGRSTGASSVVYAVPHRIKARLHTPSTPQAVRLRSCLLRRARIPAAAIHSMGEARLRNRQGICTVLQKAFTGPGRCRICQGNRVLDIKSSAPAIPAIRP